LGGDRRGQDGTRLADAGPDALAIAAAALAEAMRRIALRRHIHPDLALLVAGGGFGPLLAADIAARMGARRVLVPPAPGLLAATGLLDTPPRLAAAWRETGAGLLSDGTATARIPPGWRAAPRADGALLLERAP
jgi:N-methylhydantoinase A